MAERIPIYPIPSEADRSFVSGPRNPSGRSGKHAMSAIST